MEPITLHYAIKNNELVDSYIDNERDDWLPNNWEPNCQWHDVYVDDDDIDEFLGGLNQYLRGYWTPNQEARGYDGLHDCQEGQYRMDAVTIHK
jgi:hypothetical protein